MLMAVVAMCVAMLAVAIISGNPETVADASSSSINQFAMTETEVTNFAYSPLEAVNFVETSNCNIIQKETDRYDGVIGKNAVKKTMESTSKGVYQLYFNKCLVAKETYELSFYVKAVSEDPNFYVKVWYSGDNNTSKNEELPKVAQTNGQWLKYTYRFDADKNLAKILKLTLEPKGSYDEIYYDQICLRHVDENPVYITGDSFNNEDWQTLPENMTESAFIDGGVNFARTIANGTLTSKVLEVPESGLFRMNFAMKRTADATITLVIKDVCDNVIESRVLTNTSLSSTFDIVTGDLTEQKFVTFSFVVESTEGSAQLGLIEVVEHSHDFVGQSSVYDGYCTTTRHCGVCNLDIVHADHKFEVATGKEPTCLNNGEAECSECHVKEPIPATGKHKYELRSNKGVQVYCGDTGSRAYCMLCGAGRFLPSTHTFHYEITEDGKHAKVCESCSFEELGDHEKELSAIVKKPTFTDGGYALNGCETCGYKELLSVPQIDEDGSANWTRTVVSEPDCVTVGVVRYECTLIDIVVDVETESFGHVYESIKKDATCTESGVSLHHKCTVCGHVKEKETEIRVIEALGHAIGDWKQTKDPTLTEDGMRNRSCNVCGGEKETEIIPRLDEVNYTKYALENHDEENGYYMYYSSDVYGTYSVWIEGTHSNQKTTIIICVCFAGILIIALEFYIAFYLYHRKKQGKKK